MDLSLTINGMDLIFSYLWLQTTREHNIIDPTCLKKRQLTRNFSLTPLKKKWSRVYSAIFVANFEHHIPLALVGYQIVIAT